MSRFYGTLQTRQTLSPDATARNPGARAGIGGSSRRKAQLPLMPQSEDANLVTRHHEAIQGHVARLAIGNHELADLTVYPATEQRVCSEIFDG